MLKKNQRIDKDSFADLLKKGKSLSMGQISARWMVEESGVSHKFAFVVPSSTAKLAVERNRLKRRARNITRKNITKIKEGVSCAVFFKKGTEKMTFGEIEKKIVDLFDKIKIFK